MSLITHLSDIIVSPHYSQSINQSMCINVPVSIIKKSRISGTVTLRYIRQCQIGKSVWHHYITSLHTCFISSCTSWSVYRGMNDSNLQWSPSLVTGSPLHLQFCNGSYSPGPGPSVPAKFVLRLRIFPQCMPLYFFVVSVSTCTKYTHTAVRQAMMMMMDDDDDDDDDGRR